MGVFAITNAFIYIGPLDMTGQADDLTLRCEAETREKTTFRSLGWREHRNTLKTSRVETGGFWSSDTANDLDPEFFNNLGTNQVITAYGSEVEGETAHIMQSMQADYSLLEGSVGDLAKVRMSAVGGDGAVGQIRGKLFKEMAAVSGTGATGTGIQLGAVSATQSVYATFHVFGTPGTTITVVLESDDNSGFSSATTRITFGPITTAGGTWATPLAGALTDDWWRFRITAITGTFTIAAAAAIR